MEFAILDNTAWTRCSDVLKLNARAIDAASPRAVVSAPLCLPRARRYKISGISHARSVASAPTLIASRYKFFSLPLTEIPL